MARRDEAAGLLKRGLGLADIATSMGISVGSVTQYLYVKVGEGDVRRSDIVFAVDPRLRRSVEEIIRRHRKPRLSSVEYYLKKQAVKYDRFELQAYLQLRDSRLSRGDMYEFIADIEVSLHTLVRQVLTAEHGDGWWHAGVPLCVRKSCAARLEEDEGPSDDRYSYTTFVDLKEIVERKWSLFSQRVPSAMAQDKKKLLADLLRLNSIRNRVMHPVKMQPFTDAEFSFVRDFHGKIAAENWQIE